MSSVHQARILIEWLYKMVMYNTQLLQEDKPIDLTIFTEKIQELCTALDVLPSEQKDGFSHDVLFLITTLQEWQNILKTRQEDIKKKLEALQHSITAQHAYMRTYANAMDATDAKAPSVEKEQVSLEEQQLLLQALQQKNLK